MDEAERLAERLEAKHRDGNHLYGPDPLSVEAAQLIRSQAEELERLRGGAVVVQHMPDCEYPRAPIRICNCPTGETK
jgi:hypothetical protein